MTIIQVSPEDSLTTIVEVLNKSHGTVAKEYGFTKENNPSNNAFIDEPTLRNQLNSGITLYSILEKEKCVGCIAIELSKSKPETFYIEKVSVIPSFRRKGIGKQLIDFTILKIEEMGGKNISIGLIDSNLILKKWYLVLGFVEAGKKDFPHLPFTVCFMDRKV
jgi:ribosomal protein S18 acetylase RimI-like enzyme